ncbi:hypothetical protein BDV98DRAFT_608460 [Pterulicium gracile]|uniref:GATA-type domain-containing protein n=1 Tax=Pterulicium gracile TaxID=1884261 RepID=A0A5C3Q731_9AGAR|nr:hypothetical protein BDV98DRAFT_608460 [Pterula gracilis]
MSENNSDYVWDHQRGVWVPNTFRHNHTSSQQQPQYNHSSTHQQQSQLGYPSSGQFGNPYAYTGQLSDGLSSSHTHGAQYSSSLSAYVPSSQTQGQNTSFIPHNAIYNAPGGQYVHPNQAGYTESMHLTESTTGSAQRSPSVSPKYCANVNCRTGESPLWRRHPITNERLCNACGLYMQSHGAHRSHQLIMQAQSGPSVGSARSCTHCGATETGSWRRGEHGELLCNACGVYRKLKGKDRPLELTGDPLKKRGSRRQ